MKKAILVIASLLAIAGILRIYFPASGILFFAHHMSDSKNSNEVNSSVDGSTQDILPFQLAGAPPHRVDTFYESSLSMAQSPKNLSLPSLQDVDQALRSGRARPVMPSHLSRNYKPDLLKILPGDRSPGTVSEKRKR